MPENLRKHMRSNLKPVAVPPACRPPIGPNPIPLQEVCARAQDAFDRCVSESKALLPDLITAMKRDTELAKVSGESLRELMRSANDVRGVAKALGSELVADIAQTVFELAEKALPDGALPGSVIGLMAQSSLQVVDYHPSEDGGALHHRVQNLLTEVRKKLARSAAIGDRS